MHKDHPLPMVRGIVADSDMDLDGNMICVLPWPADHPLAKLTTCVQVPYHIMLYDIAGIMELENGKKSADGTGNSAGSDSNKETIKKDDSPKNIVSDGTGDTSDAPAGK